MNLPVLSCTYEAEGALIRRLATLSNFRISLRHFQLWHTRSCLLSKPSKRSDDEDGMANSVSTSESIICSVVHVGCMAQTSVVSVLSEDRRKGFAATGSTSDVPGSL
jgi:hypothetical protein